jgi:hypothetical protein
LVYERYVNGTDYATGVTDNNDSCGSTTGTVYWEADPIDDIIFLKDR